MGETGTQNNTVPQQQTPQGQPATQPTPQGQPATQPTPQVQVAQPAVPEFDYDKLASIIDGKRTVTEDTVLKNYFKQQGLSKEQADAAIAAFKQQQAANQPNIEEIQQESKKYAVQLRETQVINKTMLLAGELGIDIKTVPYIAKLADLSTVFGDDGAINEEKLKESISKVLEDVPGFKTTESSQQAQKPGFQQIGGSGQQQNDRQEDLLKGIFGIKKIGGR